MLLLVVLLLAVTVSTECVLEKVAKLCGDDVKIDDRREQNR